MTVSLLVRRTINAPVERVFAAWTQPEHLEKWWGPAGVTCSEAEVDLRVGGAIRIANTLPDGSTLWIEGTFEHVEPPTELVYTWLVGGGIHGAASRVRVRFEPKGQATEVIVQHDRIDGKATRDNHEAGWIGCLDGLEELFAHHESPS